MNFKIRCSAIGSITSGTIGLTYKKVLRMEELSKRKNDTSAKPLTTNMEKELEELKKQSKNKELPQGAKTYIESWVKQQVYGRRKEFTAKQTSKGNIVEDDSIDFIAEKLGYPILLKNEKSYEDEYITGTPDIVIPECVIDVKNSWDCFTFPLFENEITNKGYWWQLQGYMHLTGIKKAKLIYVLSDTPVNLIESEYRKHCYSKGFDIGDVKLYEEFKKHYTYDHIDDSYKIKTYEFEYDESAIDLIIDRVKLARNYVEKLRNLIER